MSDWTPIATNTRKQVMRSSQRLRRNRGTPGKLARGDEVANRSGPEFAAALTKGESSEYASRRAGRIVLRICLAAPARDLTSTDRSTGRPIFTRPSGQSLYNTVKGDVALRRHRGEGVEHPFLARLGRGAVLAD